MFEAGQQTHRDGADDIFMFAERRRAPTLATVSWATERRALMVLGARPSREMMSGAARPRRIAGGLLGIVVASWDAGSVLALSAEEAHPARQALERQGDHAVLADDVADHARGLGPVPLVPRDGVDPEMARPAVR